MPNNTRKYAAIKTHNRQSGSPLKSGVTSIQSAKPNAKHPSEMYNNNQYGRLKFISARSGLTKKAEPPPTRDVNRDSGTASANGGWLRRLVRRLVITHNSVNHSGSVPTRYDIRKVEYVKNIKTQPYKNYNQNEKYPKPYKNLGGRNLHLNIYPLVHGVKSPNNESTA